MEKVESVRVSSESEVDENEENGENGETEASAPKRRGRPPKKGAKAVVKEKSGRGRGRPPMNPEDAAERLKKTKESKSSNGISNGKRGRPKKVGAHKVPQKIVPTGKGRGRPKADNGEDDSESPAKSKKKSPNAKGRRGRPKKEVSESDEGRSGDELDGSNNEDDDEEVRQAGRPATGGVNLNIERTGRGQGRPQKETGKRSASDKGDSVPKKRGRPSGGGSASKSATGKPRGRPKAAEKKAAPVEDNSDNEGEENEEADSPVVQYESAADEDEGDDEN